MQSGLHSVKNLLRKGELHALQTRREGVQVVLEPTNAVAGSGGARSRIGSSAGWLNNGDQTRPVNVINARKGEQDAKTVGSVAEGSTTVSMNSSKSLNEVGWRPVR